MFLLLTPRKSSARLNYPVPPPDTEIKAEWVYMQGEVEDLTNYLIDEWSTTADNTRYISVSIIRPYDG